MPMTITTKGRFASKLGVTVEARTLPQSGLAMMPEITYAT
jgi:hypothetical protein